jgi:hypothetical protein
MINQLKQSFYFIFHRAFTSAEHVSVRQGGSDSCNFFFELSSPCPKLVQSQGYSQQFHSIGIWIEILAKIEI